jgi:hypothetical protein
MRRIAQYLPEIYKVAVLVLLILIYLKVVDAEESADQARQHAIEAEQSAGYAHEAAKNCAK